MQTLLIMYDFRDNLSYAYEKFHIDNRFLHKSKFKIPKMFK